MQVWAASERIFGSILLFVIHATSNNFQPKLEKRRSEIVKTKNATSKIVTGEVHVRLFSKRNGLHVYSMSGKRL